MAESSEEVSRRPARILLVDDDQIVLDSLGGFLTMEGYHVSSARGAEAALELLKARTFNLVLTDLKMPGMSGLDLLEEIQSINARTIALLMTGYGTVETAIEAMKKGAYDYILKPFKVSDVLRTVKHALEQQRLERENIQLREAVNLYHISEKMASILSLPHIQLFSGKRAGRGAGIGTSTGPGCR